MIFIPLACRLFRRLFSFFSQPVVYLSLILIFFYISLFGTQKSALLYALYLTFSSNPFHMRPTRLPPLDTSGYVSCPIDTPIIDFDEKSPLPCIIVTPSSPTEYHIAFHPKDSSMQQLTFAAQQQQQLHRQQTRPRRAFNFASWTTLVDVPPPVPQYLETPFRRYNKQSSRLAFLIGIPIFIIICHFLLTAFMRNVSLDSPLFATSLSRSRLASNPVHFRAYRDEPVLAAYAPAPSSSTSSFSSVEDLVIDLPVN